MARLLPRLIKPWAGYIKKLLDLWHVMSLDKGLLAANQKLLEDEKDNQERFLKMLTFIQHVAKLYSVMLSSLQKIKFSKVATPSLAPRS